MNQYLGCVICGKPANPITRERKLKNTFQGPTCDSCYNRTHVKTVDEILGHKIA